MSRQKNKKKNNEFKPAKFLKRDSSVGLFMLDDKRKIRIHQDCIENSLWDIEKGTAFTIPESLINESSIVSNQRCIVTNPHKDEKPKASLMQKMSDHSLSEQVFETQDYDTKNYGLPSGIKYYWMGRDDIPTVGSCVLISDWKKDEHKVVLVKKISEYFGDTLYGIVLSKDGVLTTDDITSADLEVFSIKKCMFTILDKAGAQMGPNWLIVYLKNNK
jgi:hypothetical protein